MKKKTKNDRVLNYEFSPLSVPELQSSLQRSPVKSLSLARCVIVAELCGPCLVPQCRTNVLQINSSSEAELR